VNQLSQTAVILAGLLICIYPSLFTRSFYKKIKLPFLLSFLINLPLLICAQVGQLEHWFMFCFGAITLYFLSWAFFKRWTSVSLNFFDQYMIWWIFISAYTVIAYFSVEYLGSTNSIIYLLGLSSIFILILFNANSQMLPTGGVDTFVVNGFRLSAILIAFLVSSYRIFFENAYLILVPLFLLVMTIFSVLISVKGLTSFGSASRSFLYLLNLFYEIVIGGIIIYFGLHRDLIYIRGWDPSLIFMFMWSYIISAFLIKLIICSLLYYPEDKKDSFFGSQAADIQQNLYELFDQRMFHPKYGPYFFWIMLFVALCSAFFSLPRIVSIVSISLLINPLISFIIERSGLLVFSPKEPELLD
jgi:hypothetical protein